MKGGKAEAVIVTHGVQAHPAQIRLARVFSSVNLLGPPLNDRLVRLVAHLFSPREAEIAEYIPPYVPVALRTIALRAGRKAAEIKPLLETMARRHVILELNKRYALIPLLPGMFEYVLMNGQDSEWHREYSRLVVDLVDTGYLKQYHRRPLPAIRNIPVQVAVEAESRALDSDRISEMIDRHRYLAVAHVCQCRQTMHFDGRECKRASPRDGCLIFGGVSRWVERRGLGRMVSKDEMREIVIERYEKKLVFMTGNVAPANVNAICTCCDCCCQGLKILSEHGGMALVAEAHFLAAVDADRCENCGKCAKVCNTHAHRFEKKKHVFDVRKCIGCGLCVDVCEPGAIRLVENRAFKPPASSYAALGLKLLPNAVRSGLEVRNARQGARNPAPSE
jgi:NAD-dependent dihydropyrimidine dehydrogenase PreA subunit